MPAGNRWRTLELIASAADLDKLLRLGYHPMIVADLVGQEHGTSENV